MMKNNLFYSIFLISFIFLSCRQNKLKESNAAIVERKMLSNGKLMLSYVFQVNNEMITGTTITENRILPVDTLKITFPLDNPSKSSVQFPQ